MTGTDIVEGARTYILQDIDTANRRFTDAESIFWIDLFVKETVRRKPDSQYTSSILTTAPAQVTTLTETLPVDDSYLGAAVDYVAFRFFNRDSEDPQNRERANHHFTMYVEGLGL